MLHSSFFEMVLCFPNVAILPGPGAHLLLEWQKVLHSREMPAKFGSLHVRLNQFLSEIFLLAQRKNGILAHSHHY